MWPNDWNHNGKVDGFDRFMDYTIFNEVFNSDDDEDDEDDDEWLNSFDD